ncbi:MAG: DUF3073 domain-containing protein [Propionibacteriaceae bacterium]|jgi:hypothetical protein|nr:DUF3073 domain-containing protein [Propionibacteriaceae bacterium]
MGRGRQKAKQTKVARELKYRSQDTDFASLAEELRKSSQGDIPLAYADLADKYSEDDEDLEDEYGDYPDEDDEDTN